MTPGGREPSTHARSLSQAEFELLAVEALRFDAQREFLVSAARLRALFLREAAAREIVWRESRSLRRAS